MGTKYQVDGDDLTAIANKIRSKGGTSASLEFPDGFKDAVDAIQTGITPTGTKNISTNGTHDVTNYASANVAVPASAVDTGTKNINSNGTHDVVGYASAAVSVPNSYSQSDEGKVVSNGALVAQTSDTVTQNGTVDTTLIDELTVNVSGGGGSGGIKVASGTFTGDNNPQIAIPVGKKMPKTDFVFSVWCDDGTEIEYSNNTKLLEVMLIANKHFAIYDLSSDGSKDATGQITVGSNNSGTITNRTPKGVAATNWTIRNGGLGYGALGNWGSSSNCFIIRDSNGFTVRLYSNNSSTFLASGITYKWELVYFGSDPTNDIVEVA